MWTEYLIMVLSSIFSTTVMFLFISYIFRNSKSERTWILVFYSILFVGEVLMYFLLYVSDSPDVSSWILFAIDIVIGIIPYFIIIGRYGGLGIKSIKRKGTFKKKSRREPGVSLYTGNLRKYLLISLIILTLLTITSIVLKFTVLETLPIILMALLGLMNLLLLIYYFYQWRYKEEKIFIIIGKHKKFVYQYDGDMSRIFIKSVILFTDERYIVEYGGRVLKKSGKRTDIYHFFILPTDVESYTLKKFIIVNDEKYTKYKDDFISKEEKIIRD